MERFRGSISLNRGNGDNEEIVHADAFPKRMRGAIYTFSTADIRDLHNIYLSTCETYTNVHKEWCRAFGKSSPELSALGIQDWKPWSVAGYEDSKSWRRRNSFSLRAALTAFKRVSCRAVMSGVWYGGERRTGSNELAATKSHAHANSIFEFVAGDEHTYGKILFMFQINVLLPGKAAVSIFLVLVCLEIVFPLGVVFLLAHFYLIICSYYFACSII